MASAVNVPISKAMSTITIKVTGLRTAVFRMRVAALVFRIGARIAGVGIIIDTTKDGDEWRTYRRDDSCASLVDQINEEMADGARLKI